MFQCIGTFMINSYVRRSIMNRNLFAVHRWTGLISGIFLLLIGISGSILVYQRSLERWLNPGHYNIGTARPRLSLDSLFNIVYKKYGENSSACSVDIPSGATEIVEFTATKEQENHRTRDLYIIDINPYTGEIL